ncbi:right-handed parallel beta-helix repeat-containing protein, partial [Candidatus Dependentiae bacterium]|nr:right-handed parallel beta-helix repeat-containing protein [Candidatus Dependentiae bacterium]
ENGIGGNYLFATSHLWCKKSQTIDLIAKGYTAAELDSVPKIYVECWVGQRMPQDIFKFYVSLKNGSLTEITSYNTGEIATPANWTKYSYTFTGYGSGLRYIHFENWGEDGSLGWAGYYGTFFDNELVMLDNAWNDVPYIMLQGKISYTEQSGTTAVFANAVVRDIDSTNFNGGSLIIGFDSGTGNIYDSFSIRHQGTGAGEIGVSGNNVSYNGVTFATFSGGSTGTDTLIVYLNANSGADTVEALLKNILYQNRSDAPDTKYLRVQLNDGGAETAQYIQTISFILVNDSPVLTLSDSISVIMGSETTMLFNASHISDSDASDSISNISLIIFDTDIVRITVDTGTGIDTFHFNAIGTAAGADTVIVKIIDRTGAFDTKTFVVNVFAAPYTGTKWYVSNDTGSNIFNNGSETFPFKTITKALSSVNTNDSVFVFAGTYNETVVITQNGISIIGADSGLTIIDPIGDSTVTTLYGIYANGLNNLRIANLKIFDCYSGIYFDNIDTSVIENIFIQNCGKNGGSGIGVYLTNGSCSNTISNCYVFKNYYGICVNNSAYNLLYGNSVISNQFYGIYAYNGSSFNYFSNNRSDSNNTGIYTYQNSDTNTFISNFVNYNQGHGIRLDSNNGCNILTNNVSNYNNNHGISVNGFNNIIQNNIANYNTWAGFNFTASSNNLFETNTASNNLQNGFQFANASNNIFKNNVSKSNNQSGFVLGSNFNNNIFIGNSSIANNERGFYLDNVSSNYFAQNDIKNNTGYQIYLLNSSTSDTFIKNNIQTSMINPNYAVCNSAASIFDMKYNYYNTTDSSVISSKINIAGGSILWLPFRTSEIDTFSGADTVAPEAPSFISSDTSVLKQVTLRWTKPVLDENGGALTGLTGYRIYRAGASQCRANGDTDNWELFFIFSTENVNDTEYTDTGFNATGTYYYRIVAFDSHSTNGQLFYNRSWYSGGIQVYARYNSAPETPVLLTPVNLPVPYTEYATYGRTLNQKPTLIWRCPADADSNALYFLIYFDSGFGLTLLANSANDTRGFYYYKSGSYDTFSSGGADSSVYGNTVYYNPQINLSDSLYMWTVIAYDSDLYSDTANLRRFKIGGRTWTDGTITAGTTLIRKIHIDELREEIDFARKLRGLSAFSWTDPVITAGETLIRKIHLDELRAASEQTAASGFYSIPVWTEPAITSGQTLIRKIFYDELRQKLTGF